jgi:hypothetical protein
MAAWQPALLGVLAQCATLAPADDDIPGRELHFLPALPPQPIHYHHKHLTLSTDSLISGWADHQQCHYRLDPVAALEVVFKKEHVRKLAIRRAEHIGRAWIEDSSVQLQDVGPDAVLCIASESRVVRHDAPSGRYTLNSGPYMRRYLDGYFPLQLTLVVDYPTTLQLDDIQPPELRLHTIDLPGHLQIDAVFEGQLVINLGFTPKKVEKTQPKR